MMAQKHILTLALAISTGFGLSFAVPAMADSVPSATISPTTIEQKSEIQERKDAQAAKVEEQKSKEDAVEIQRKNEADAKIEDLKKSKTQAANDYEANQRNVQDERDKIHREIINNNKVVTP